MTIRIIRTASLGLPVGTFRTLATATEAALVADKEAVYDALPTSLAGPVTADAAGNLLANGQPLSSVSGAGIVAGLVAGSSAAASANSTAIQAALDAGGVVSVAAPSGSIVWIGATLKIGSNTTLSVSPGVEIKATTGVGNLLQSKAYTLATTSVTVAWSSGIQATVTWTGHGLTAGQSIWLTGNTASALIGVFRILSVTDANNFIILLQRIPAATGGTNVACVADVNVTVTGGIWNYNNTGGNSGTNTTLFSIILGGIDNLVVRNIGGKDQSKYLLNVGAVNGYVIDGVRGENLLSDLVKVYGPAFGGNVSNLMGTQTDDLISFQTKEPTAYAGYRWTYGDILGATVTNASGNSNTGAILLYPSPSETLDGITINGYQSTVSGAVYGFRIDNNHSGTSATVGTVTLNNPVFRGDRTAIGLGLANTLIIPSLVINNPSFASSNGQRRFIEIGGGTVSANLVVNGGYIAACDAVFHANNATAGGVINARFINTIIGNSYTTFTAGPVTLNLEIDGVRFEQNPGNFMLNAAAGNPTINFRARNLGLQSNGITTATTGSPTLVPKGVEVIQQPAHSATPTFDFMKGQIVQPGTMTANVTSVTLSNIPAAGERVTFILTQDATGGRTWAWPASCVFATAWVEAIVTTDANKSTSITFVSNGTKLFAQGTNKWS